MDYQKSSDIKGKIREILSRRKKNVLLGKNLVSAAVLVPLFRKNDSYHILFTRRTETVEHHKGQISFPGGIREEQDRDLKMTVLREVFEEIGLKKENIELVGEIDDMETLTGFQVTPFIGFIPYPFDFRLSRDEIEELIEVPFSFFTDRHNCREEVWMHEGIERNVYVFQYNHHRIWGATARIMKHFVDLLLEGESSLCFLQ
jgi:8-oxo-dGTP pyrophosphatase MutT (NUDIX family)